MRLTLTKHYSFETEFVPLELEIKKHPTTLVVLFFSFFIQD